MAIFVKKDASIDNSPGARSTELMFCISRVLKRFDNGFQHIKTSSFTLGSLWFQIVVYILSYSYVFVSRYRLKKVSHENEAEIATQFIHRNLFDKRINVIQITDKTI